MNPITPLELLDIIEREHGFESPALRIALTELEKVTKLLELYKELVPFRYTMKRYYELNEQIKALEEELDEST